MMCSVCRKEICAFQDTQRIPPPEKSLVGPRSGVIGLYPHPEYQSDEEETVHYPHCCMQYFDPHDNDRVYEVLRAQIAEEVTNEQYETMREEIVQELHDELPMGAHEPDPDCLWCKSSYFVWRKSSKDGPYYYCTKCVKYWNDDDEELAMTATG